MAVPNKPVPKVIGTKHPQVSYTDRHAVRVVVKNTASEVAIIYVEKGNYYKLPGGGIEAAEDHHEAARREVAEETGATVTFRHADCFAITEEFRDGLHQISYGYCADLLDGSGKPNLTEEEVVDGLRSSWVPLEEALGVMTGVEPTSELGRYIKERDSYLLSQAMDIREVLS